MGPINFKAYQREGGVGDVLERWGGGQFLYSLEVKMESLLFSEMSPSFNEYETLCVSSVLKTYDNHNLSII